MKLLNNFYFLAIGFSRPIISMCIIYISYLLFGAVLFVTLEESYDKIAQDTTMKHIQATKGMIEALRQANYSDKDIQSAFLEEQKRLELKVDPTSVGWSKLYMEKMFFSLILITTIGYGNVAPKSTLAQMVCIIYTLFGLPINVIMMRLLSFKFRSALRWIFKKGQAHYPGSNIPIVLLGFLFFIFWLAIFILIPAYIFVLIEKWDYNKGVYYSFVSLTTIGLGDLVAGVSSAHIEESSYFLHAILMILWIFFGLAFVTMVVNMLSYFLGVLTLDKLDCKCRKRTAAMEKLKVLLDLVKELNWQLVKSRPDDFTDWEEIEQFRNVLSENPQDVTPQMLQKMFAIVVDLKEKCYNQLYRTETTEITLTPALLKARDNLPGILSTDSVTISLENLKRNPSKIVTIDSKTHTEVHRSSSEEPVPLDDEKESESEFKSSKSQKNFLHRGKFKPSSPEAKHISDIPVQHEVEDRTNVSETEDKTNVSETSEDRSRETEDKQESEKGGKDEKRRKENPGRK